MKQNNYKKAGSFYFIGNIFNKGIAFLTVPIFTRILSTKDYGVVTTYNSWIGILGMIMGLALHMSVRMASVDYEDEIDDFMSSIILFVLSSSFVVIAIVTGCIKILNIKTSIVLVIVCMIHAISTAIIEDYSSYLMMQYQYILRTVLMIFPNLLSVITSIVVIKLVLTENLYYGRIIPTAMITSFFGVIVTFLIFRKGKLRICKEYIRYALAISAPLILHGIALNILSQSDRIMISSFADSSQTGIYGLIYNFSMIATVITTSLEGLWVPWFINKLKTGTRKAISIVAKDYILLMSSAMIVVILIAPEVVKVLANENYWEGISIIPPVVISNYIIFAYSLYVNVEHYYKKTPYITINTVIAAVSNVILNFIFIPQYGYVAAAYTTLVSYLISFILHSRYARKLEPDLFPLRQFVPSLVQLLLATILYYYFKEEMILRWLLTLLYVLLIIFNNKNRLMEYFPNLFRNNNVGK